MSLSAITLTFSDPVLPGEGESCTVPKLRPSPIPSRIVRSAGAVVWRPRKGNPMPAVGEAIAPQDMEVLVVHRPRYDDWSWPKGKAEVNEPLIVAGVREVEEETGVLVAMGAPLTTQRYRLGSGHTKEVHYWVGTVVSHPAVQRGRAPVVPASQKEIDNASWVSVERAHELLTRRGDRRLLDEVTARALSGDLRTVTLALVRHGSSVSRSQWPEDEGSRPLARAGGRQAVVAAQVLSALGVERVLSSSWARCRRTLEVYSSLTGLPLVETHDLTEDAVAAEPKVASRVVKQVLRRPGAPIAVCSHRPVFPALLKPLLKASSNQMRRQFPAEDPYLRPGQILVAHLAYGEGDPRVFALQAHQPFFSSMS